jgi:hypothetical protein
MRAWFAAVLLFAATPAMAQTRATPPTNVTAPTAPVNVTLAPCPPTASGEAQARLNGGACIPVSTIPDSQTANIDHGSLTLGAFRPRLGGKPDNSIPIAPICVTCLKY